LVDLPNPIHHSSRPERARGSTFGLILGKASKYPPGGTLDYGNEHFAILPYFDLAFPQSFSLGSISSYVLLRNFTSPNTLKSSCDVGLCWHTKYARTITLSREFPSNCACTIPQQIYSSNSRG